MIQAISVDKAPAVMSENALAGILRIVCEHTTGAHKAASTRTW